MAADSRRRPNSTITRVGGVGKKRRLAVLCGSEREAQLHQMRMREIEITGVT